MSSALAIPSVLLLFDFSAIVETDPRDWQGFERVGPCCLPRQVYDELTSWAQAAIDPTQAAKARAFLRFVEQTASWQIVEEVRDHPALKPTAGHSMSHRARLSLEVARCAHGFAQANPDQLVVLVTNAPMAFQGLQAIQLPNLCLLLVNGLLSWSRTDRKPSIVAQQLLALRNARRVLSMGMTSVTPRTPAKVAPPDRASLSRTEVARTRSNSPTPTSRTQSVKKPATRSDRRSGQPESLSSVRPRAAAQIVSGLVALVTFLIVVLTCWYVLSPQSLNRFLRDRRWPTLPPLATQPIAPAIRAASLNQH